MSNQCANCGAAFTEGGTFKAPNHPKKQATVSFVNLVNNSEYKELCDRCGENPSGQAFARVTDEISEKTQFIQGRFTDFPMFTLSWLPAQIEVTLKNMITANITVGTGFFSEFSQGLSDLTGAVNVDSGMSYKVNKGEASARSIIVMKALSLGANCVLGVDIDYGTTANNAATINMQGTAAVVANIEALLHPDALQGLNALQEAFARIVELRRWRAESTGS